MFPQRHIFLSLSLQMHQSLDHSMVTPRLVCSIRPMQASRSGEVPFDLCIPLGSLSLLLIPATCLSTLYRVYGKALSLSPNRSLGAGSLSCCCDVTGPSTEVTGVPLPVSAQSSRALSEPVGMKRPWSPGCSRPAHAGAAAQGVLAGLVQDLHVSRCLFCVFCPHDHS